MKVYYDEDADLGALEGEAVAILGYGIQGRAQALTLRDSGVRVVVGNCPDPFRDQARADGFQVHDIKEAVHQSSLAVVLLPDEVQPEVYRTAIEPGLTPGKGLVFAHGFSVHYGLIRAPTEVDVMMLAPRMPGQFLRRRYLAGWGVPAFVAVQQESTGRAWQRLLALARALGVTRCGAIVASFAQETELDHFSEHFTYPMIFRTLEVAFEALVEAGYPPELALMELHGSEELSQVLLAAAREGLFGMIDSHASPACQAGIAHYWERSLGSASDLKRRAVEVLKEIRNGCFARHLVAEAQKSYPELKRWRRGRPKALEEAEQQLRIKLREGPSN
jgi:ketol-acid reductoisomerase